MYFKGMIYISRIKIVKIFLIVSAILTSMMFFTSVIINKTSIAETSTQNDEIIYYTLKEYKGYIALFTGENNEPTEVFDTEVNSLSDYDKNLMKEGITEYSYNAIRNRIEDFTS